jgi:tetratricopeptide (TPR) repeat protein
MTTFPNSKLIGRAHYNIGYINFQTKNYEKAKEVFLAILNNNYNEKDPNGLMEQYTLYKHRSCEYLAEICLADSNFKEAKKYIHLFDKRYPYQHFCGNELAAYDIYRARAYARLFEGEQMYTKAMRELLPFTFENGLAHNDNLLIDLVRITKKAYPINYIKPQLEEAMKSLKMKRKKNEEYGIIRLFGRKVKVLEDQLYALGNPEMTENMKLEGIEKFKKVMITNQFFQTFLNNQN